VTAAVPILPLGDAAVLVDVAMGATEGDPGADARVQWLAHAVDELRATDPGFGPAVPGSTSVLVPVDPLDPGVDGAIARLGPVLARMVAEPPAPTEAGPLIDVPTRYGGAHGPDLDEVATLHDLRPPDVVDIHASVEYRVRFLGFAPGFAYLGGVPDAIQTPRLATPRERVPAGSVAIAGPNTTVYPFDTPGGWRLIGWTDARIWDLGRHPPALLLPGHRVRFVPVRGP
jgi:KipI family sensor histidine kinase inhibitor